MLMKDFDKQYDIVMGNENDVCFYCLMEYKKDNPEKGPIESREALKGKLTYQHIFKNRRIGDGFTICKDHIAKIANEIGLTVEELQSKAKKAK